MSLLSDVPPIGQGVYARLEPASELARYDFVAMWHRFDRAIALRDSGVPSWFYFGPSSMQPDNWADGLQRLIQKAQEYGAEGIIVDAEGGWSGNPQIMNDKAARLGAAMAEASQHVRVGFTSYPLWARLGALAAECQGQVWATPQIYAKTASPESRRRWFAQWQDRFGSHRVIPSISGWIAPEDRSLSTPEGYDAYLATIPDAAGSIAFLHPTLSPAHIRNRLAERAATVVPSQWLHWALAFMSSPARAAIVIVGFLLILAATAKAAT